MLDDGGCLSGEEVGYNRMTIECIDLTFSI